MNWERIYSCVHWLFV